MIGLQRYGAATALCLVLAGAAAQAPGPAPAAAVHGAIPFKQEKQAGETMVWQSIAGVVLAGLAAYGAALGIRRIGAARLGPMRAQRRLHVVESLRLGRRSVLHVVAYRGKELLLAEGEHGVSLIDGAADIGKEAADA
jgi:flagellar biogenesis protein FliO